MVYKQTGTGRATSVPKGLARGVMFSLCILFLGTAVTAKFIDLEIISWDSAGYLIMLYLILSSWIGAVFSFRSIKRQRFAVCIMNGLFLILSLMILTALFFGGQYSGVGETILLIICGSGLAVMTGSGRDGSRKRKIRLYNR